MSSEAIDSAIAALGLILFGTSVLIFVAAGLHAMADMIQWRSIMRLDRSCREAARRRKELKLWVNPNPPER